MQLPILLALLVLVLVERCCTAATLHRGGGRTMMDMRHTRPGAGSTGPGSTGPGLKTGERKSRSHHRAESHHRDPQHKDKFIIHLTGPLNVNPKCRKHFNRLYYNTRDCTVPAYYKRCARLLTRLASSPRCSET